MKRLQIEDRQTVNVSTREITPEGYLKANVAFTTVGVQEYWGDELGLDPKKKYGIYRPADTVFHPETANSLQLKPVTDTHPQDDVTVDNYSRLSVGNVGDNIGPLDNKRLGGQVLITDKSVIDKVDKGTDEVSLGYLSEIIEEEGVFEGVNYQYRFDGPMICNHLAVVPKGRCGENVRILDAGGSVMKKSVLLKALKDAGVAPQRYEDVLKDLKDDDPVETDVVIKLMADAGEEEKSPSLEQLEDAMRNVLDEMGMKKMEKDMDPMEMFAKMMAYMMGMGMDGMYGKKGMDAKPEDDEEGADVDKAIADAANTRAMLLVDALPLLGEDSKPEEMSNREIMVAVLGDSIEKSEEKSDDYVQAMYDRMIADRKVAGDHVKAGYNDSSTNTVKRKNPLELRKAMRIKNKEA